MSNEAERLMEHEPDPGPTESRVVSEPGFARQERSRFPGWIWSVPIAAIAIVAWLAFKQIAATGPEITVVFPEAGGISAGTSVQYQGMQVGAVESVRFEDDLKRVRSRIRMDAALAGHLGAGTQFWISGPSLTDLASIKSVISGPSIGVLPQPGPVQREYAGQIEPPLLEGVVPGRRFLLHAKRIGSIGRGTAVYFRDLNVGFVEATRFQPDQTFEMPVFIKAPFDKLVHADTRFWNAGAVQLSMEGGSPRLQVQSLSALLSGAVAMETPGSSQQTEEAPAGALFTLYGSKDDADYAPGNDAVLYRVVFGADAGGLADKAPVMLAGKQIGTVQRSALQYDKEHGTLRQDVMLAIEPSRIGLVSGRWPADARADMDGMLRRLIADGLRARLGSGIPVLGPQDVELAFVPGAPAAALTGNPPEIPAAPGGAGLENVMTALNGIASKIGSLPLDQIAGDIHVATAQLAQLSTSPKLTGSLDALDRSVVNLEQITASARTELPAVLLQLRQVARDAAGAVSQARQVMATVSGQGVGGLESAGLGETLYELTRAARAIRELADFLDRNPSALLRGRQ